jgi:membrane protease subunit (stomatin/prohibitin family)
MNWDKDFESPFKSEVYFFSTRQQIDQKWGTATPITIRDKEFGAVRLRCFGIYSYRIADPRVFFNQVSGTRECYFAADLEGQLRDTILASMTGAFATSNLAFLDLTANQAVLAEKISAQMKPVFAGLGLELTQFVVENISLPEELSKVLDQRIGMSMVGDVGRYTQYAAAESLDLAAANTGGGAGVGMGLGAGAAVAQVLATSLKPLAPAPAAAAATAPSNAPAVVPAVATDTKFCIECGKPIAARAKFCAECGKPQ